jgi:hypothetical protein
LFAYPKTDDMQNLSKKVSPEKQKRNSYTELSKSRFGISKKMFVKERGVRSREEVKEYMNDLVVSSACDRSKIQEALLLLPTAKRLHILKLWNELHYLLVKKENNPLML